MGKHDRVMTDRQRDVWELIKRGKTNKQIGEALGIAPGTVKTHVNRLLAKYGCHNRTQLSHVPVFDTLPD
jgi:DNA-binding NarL/FixJ family response regulator